MKRKIFSVLLALVLVLSFSLVTAVPAAAATPELELGIKAPGATAEWSTAEVDVGTYSVHLKTGDTGDGNEGRIVIDAASVGITTLSSITSIAWSVYTVAGYPPHVDIYLDCDGDEVVDDEDVLTAELHYNNADPVFEFNDMIAKVNYDTWLQTFELTSDDGFGAVGDTTLLWLSKLGGGPGDAPAGTLAQWKAGTVGSDTGNDLPGGTVIDDTAPVLRLEIEVDRWMIDSEAYIDDLTINGTTYDVEWIHVSPIQVDDDKVQYPTAPFHTIQDAIDSAITGDTISVAAGTYTEDLTIGTALTLESVAGAATTIIATAGSVDDIVLVTAADVTIDGFTIDGANVASGAVNGIDVRNTGFIIQNNVFVEIYYDNIFTGNTAATITSGFIDSNTFTGMGTSAAAYRPAINVESNSSYAISGVTVSNNTISAYGGTESAGIQVAEVTGAVSTIVVSGNTIGTSSFGIATWNDGAATFTGNTITGCDVGVDIYGDVADLTPVFTLSGNTITGNTTYGIRVRSDANDLTGVGIVISGNTISGNGDGVAVVTSGTINSGPVAQYNWWGAAAGPAIATNPYNTPTTGDSVSANVDYIPWLIHTELASGWNIYSTPIALDSSCNTIGDALDIWTADSGNFVIAYYFDSSASPQAFAEVTSLTPLQAIYIQMSAASTIDVISNTSYTAPPSRIMYQGWNLIGLAELYNMDAEDALASAYYVAGANNIGYSQVVSPGLGQTAWSATRRATIVGPSYETMVPCEGYWVYMVNQGNLGGFTSTPITEVTPPQQ